MAVAFSRDSDSVSDNPTSTQHRDPHSTQHSTQDGDYSNEDTTRVFVSEPDEVDFDGEIESDQLINSRLMNQNDWDDLKLKFQPEKGDYVAVNKLSGTMWGKLPYLTTWDEIEAFEIEAKPGKYRAVLRRAKGQIKVNWVAFIVGDGRAKGWGAQQNRNFANNESVLLQRLVEQSQQYERERNNLLMQELKDVKTELREERRNANKDEGGSTATILKFMAMQAQRDRDNALQLEKMRIESQKEIEKLRMTTSEEVARLKEENFQIQINQVLQQLNEKKSTGFDTLLESAQQVETMKEIFGGNSSGDKDWVGLIQKAMPLLKDGMPMVRDFMQAMKADAKDSAETQTQPQKSLIVGNNPDGSMTWNHHMGPGAN